MIDNNQPELQTLAQKVGDYAKENNLLKDSYIYGLIKSLASQVNVHIFAELDPFEQLPRAKAKKHDTLQLVTRVLTVIRNVGVFVPVAVIWQAVGQATTQFELYVTDNPGAITNFLTFWQNGYGYLEYRYTIGHIAYVDFLIILGIIILTFILNITGGISENIKYKEEAVLDKRRDDLCLEILTTLDNYKRVNPEGVERALAKSIVQINSTLSELNIAATSIRAALKETESLLAVESKGKAQEASIKAAKVKELEDALNSMIKTLQKFESTTENNLVKSITQTSSKIKEIGASLQKSDQQLKKTVNSAITELKKVKPAVAKLKSQGKNDRKS